MKTLRLISILEEYSRQLEESGFDVKGGEYNLSAPDELRRIIGNLGYKCRFEPKQIRLSDYTSIRSRLIDFQTEFGLDVQNQIDELSEYIDDAYKKKKTQKEASLTNVRKAYIGKVIDFRKLQNCENKRLKDNLLTFYFYINDSFEEYMYDVTIHVDGNKIIAIEPMQGQKLKSESERRVNYAPCRTKTEHYAELGEILAIATD